MRPPARLISRSLLNSFACGMSAAFLGALAASAQTLPTGSNPAQARDIEQRMMAPAPGAPDGGEGWPKISFDILGSVDYANMGSNTGPGRKTGFVAWADATLLLEFNDALSVDGLFQFKPRQPLAGSNPNRELFINRGLERREGGKMKELYVRYGDWRFGKFVPDFGRAYALLPGPYASDFLEEPEQGYEPSDMMGVEKIHVFDNEDGGWKQLSLTAFMADRTFLHQSFPFNEGMIHFKDGGVGNTRWPENLMATYDVLNKPIGNWAHMNYQASVIRWGRSYGEQRGEWWTTAGADIVIPVNGTVADTLRGQYSQFRFYVEGARRDNFEGVAGRTRNYLSGSAEYMLGPWLFDLTTAHRWTTDRTLPQQKDESYTASIGYTLPSQTILSLSVARETVGSERGLYAGLRLTHAFNFCSKCLIDDSFY